MAWFEGLITRVADEERSTVMMEWSFSHWSDGIGCHYAGVNCGESDRVVAVPSLCLENRTLAPAHCAESCCCSRQADPRKPDYNSVRTVVQAHQHGSVRTAQDPQHGSVRTAV